MKKKSEIDVYTWNVNGIRSCGPKGLFSFLQEERPEMVCLQETKISDDLIPLFADHPDYHTSFACSKRKGLSGVAIYTRKDWDAPTITLGLGIAAFDDEGRCLIAEYPEFILFSCYFPNGQRDHNRVPFKLEFSRAVHQKALELQKKRKKPVIIAGDYNTAHHPIDLKNPKQNVKTTGFLPIERAWMDEFLSGGFSDIFREQHPEEEGHYTWWTYRGDCRERNIGWRIDYLCPSLDLKDRVVKSFHRPEILGSDHCATALRLRL